MIEKIQFGGITRRPSDLMAKEGSCEESLNVVLDVNEIAPVIEPEDKTGSLIGDSQDVLSNMTDQYIYIHKTGSYENYIAYNATGNDLRAYVRGVRSGPLIDFTTIAETFSGITSIGNTLMVSTDKNIHYLIYKSDATPDNYVYLGTKIPEPLVDFRAVPVAAGEGEKTYRKSYTFTDVMESILTGGGLAAIFYAAAHAPNYTMKEFWDELATHYGETSTDEDMLGATEAIDTVTSFIWDQYNIMKQKNIKSSIFSTAVFVRCALKLYDESYIYQSVPFLLHCGSNASMVVWGEKTSNTGGIGLTLGNVYKAKVTVTYPDLGDWSDIVRSVDFFVSTDICNPKVNARVDGAVEWPETNPTTYLKFLGQSDWQDIADVKDEILSKVNFYLADSKNVEEVKSGLTFYLKPETQDNLLVKEALPDDNLSHHKIYPKDGITSYNSRLVFRGLMTTIYTGHPFLQSTWFQNRDGASVDSVFENDYMEFRYFIRTEDGTALTVIGRNSLGQQPFSYPTESVDGATLSGLPCGFLFYPDPRCYRCDIYYGNAYAPVACYSVPMTEHPGLNGAYAICDLTKPVSTLDASPDTTVSEYPVGESRTYAEDNKLVMSEAMNPFQFLLTNRQTFTDPILSVATTTKALSSGQFGQFPLYVFTKSGVWAVPVTSTGAMADAVPLSRDVVLSSKSITPIDQAVVFVTEKGVMLLSGSDISDISPEMEGRHYAMEAEAAALLDGSAWEKYFSILSDTTPFMAFMKDAQAVYDYAGRKLVFFNGTSPLLQSYQYVYKMDTQTWHKMSLLQTGASYVDVLNSYPDALVCLRDTGSIYRLYDLSVPYDPQREQATLSQVIISRPLDLRLAHVYKTVKRLYIRGILDHSHVDYLLLGSPDGRNYHVIHSLRGPSNNIFFRVMLFATLSPTERISYLEVEFEPRFTDRIR